MIKKFKTIEEASKPIYHITIDKKYLGKINNFFMLMEKLNNFRVVQGIKKNKDPFNFKEQN